MHGHAEEGTEDSQVGRGGHPIAARALAHAFLVRRIFCLKNSSKTFVISSGAWLESARFYWTRCEMRRSGEDALKSDGLKTIEKAKLYIL